MIDALEEHNWLDERTRALFIEFTVYNANVNLFGSVILLIEWMAAGSAVTRTEVKVILVKRHTTFHGSGGNLLL